MFTNKEVKEIVNVLHIPQMKNMLLVSRMTNKGTQVLFKKIGCLLYKDDRLLPKDFNKELYSV
jgi:hypothetical protein